MKIQMIRRYLSGVLLAIIAFGQLSIDAKSKASSKKSQSSKTGGTFGGGAATMVGLVAAYKAVSWYLQWLKTNIKTYQDFVRVALQQADAAVLQAKQAAVARYGSDQSVTAAEQSQIRTDAVNTFIENQAASALGIDPTKFKSYLQNVDGATIADKLQTVQSIVNTLTSDSRVLGSFTPEDASLKAAQYVVENNIAHQANAGRLVNKWAQEMREKGTLPTGEGDTTISTGSGSAASGATNKAMQDVAAGLGQTARGLAQIGKQGVQVASKGVAAGLEGLQQGVNTAARNIEEMTRVKAAGKSGAADINDGEAGDYAPSAPLAE